MLSCLVFLLVLSTLIAGCKERPPPPEGVRCSKDDPGRKLSSACGAARGKEACEAAGGNWNNGHLEKQWACDCPASKCWCESEGDCSGSCYTSAKGSPPRCDEAVYGVCVVRAYGCGCHLRDGKWSYICID